jgi:hypothetical protein
MTHRRAFSSVRSGPVMAPERLKVVRKCQPHKESGGSPQVAIVYSLCAEDSAPQAELSAKLSQFLRSSRVTLQSRVSVFSSRQWVFLSFRPTLHGIQHGPHARIFDPYGRQVEMGGRLFRCIFVARFDMGRASFFANNVLFAGQQGSDCTIACCGTGLCMRITDAYL